MEGGVGEAGGTEIRVMDEFGVRFKNPRDEEGVVVLDCPAEAERGVDPVTQLVPSLISIEVNYILTASLSLAAHLQYFGAEYALKIVECLVQCLLWGAGWRTNVELECRGQGVEMLVPYISG
jgi:hypothetical protein